MSLDRRQLLTTLGVGATGALGLGASSPLSGNQPTLPGECAATLAATTMKSARLGDWTGGRDDAHLQRAINAMASAGGALFVEPGAPLRIAAPVRLRSGVHLIGQPSGLPQKAGFGGDRYRFDITACEAMPDRPAIQLDPSSSIAGFTFYWPGQRGDTPRPVEYGWALGTSGAGAGADNILIERMMLTNPWRGINMDHGGQWRVSDIYGQPLNTGIRIDRMLDVSQLFNIHWWDFDKQAGPLHDFVRANCIGCWIGHADNLMASRIFGYNVRTLLKLSDFGHGPAWAQIDDVALDRGVQVLDVEAVNKLQIDRIIATQPQSGTGQPVGIFRKTIRNAQVTINGAMFDNVSNGIVVEDGATGRFALNGLSSQKRTGNGDNQQYALVVEGQDAEVFASGLNYADFAGPVTVDGIKAPALDHEVTPPRFATPHLWTPQPRVRAVAGGSRFDLAGPVTTIGFGLPPAILQETALFVLDATLTLKGKERLGSGQFYVRMSDGRINDLILPSRNFGGYFDRPTRLIKPFPLRSEAYRLEIVFGGAAQDCAMELTGLRLWRLDPARLDARLIDWTYAGAPNEAGLQQNVSMVAGTRVIRRAGPPDAGNFRTGDRVVAAGAGSGGVVAWVCEEGGTPGRWVPAH